MNLVPYFFMVVIAVIMFHSLVSYVRFKVNEIRLNKGKRHISFEVFYTLIVIYCTAIIGFGLIYFILSFEMTMFIDTTSSGKSILHYLYKSIYFSGVTMLTIGYGDITPINIGRFIALIQALVGYILPTAFVLKVVQTKSRK